SPFIGYSGTVFLGMIVDPDHTTLDEDFSNNQNRGLTLDQRTIQLYDPVAGEGDWKGADGRALTFRSRAQAERFLLEHFFSHGGVPGTAAVWFRDLDDDIPQYSVYNGNRMPADAFCAQARVVRAGANRFRINVVGGDDEFNPANLADPFGEPNPRATQAWGADI